MKIANNVLLPEVSALLSQGYEVTLPAKGRSMYPFIVGGRDSVVLKQVAEPVGRGDIVLACLPDREQPYVLHRVHRLTDDGIVLLGDGNVRPEYCRLQDVCGKVVRIIRNGRPIDCRSTSERWRGRIWQALTPVRRYILFFRRSSLCR